MNVNAPLLIAVLTLTGAPAFAFHHHHHHHHFSSHSSSSHHSLEGICLRWANVPVDAGVDAGVLEQAEEVDVDGGELFDADGGEETDGGEDLDDAAGTPVPGTVRVCVERLPSFGCSVSGGSSAGIAALMPFAVLALALLSRRRVPARA